MKDVKNALAAIARSLYTLTLSAMLIITVPILGGYTFQLWQPAPIVWLAAVAGVLIFAPRIMPDQQVLQFIATLLLVFSATGCGAALMAALIEHHLSQPIEPFKIGQITHL